LNIYARNTKETIVAFLMACAFKNVHFAYKILCVLKLSKPSKEFETQTKTDIYQFLYWKII